MHAAERRVRVELVGGACLVMPAAAPRVDDIEALRTVLEEALARAPLPLLFVVPASMSLPGDEARHAMRALLSDVGPRLSAVAAVIEGQGFRAAAKRSVVTFVTGVLARDVRLRVFSGVDEACLWLDAVDLEAIGAAVARARVQLDPA